MLSFGAAILLMVGTRSGGSARLPYHLTTTRQGELQIVRLYNRHNGRLVWQRTFRYAWLHPPFLGWSSDHHALAFLVKDHHNMRIHPGGSTLLTPDMFRIFVWRAGERPQLIAHRALLQTEYDGAYDFQWSPDDSRLAFRAEGSGDLDAGIGRTCCLDPATGRIREGPWGVRRMRWVGRHRIRYWLVRAVRVGPQNVDLVTARHSHLWRCP